MKDIESFVTKIRDGLRDLPKEHEYLSNDLKRIEDELNDINHYIEFCNLNASQAWNIYDSQRNLRRERRKIKDRLEQLNVVQKLFEKMEKQLGDELNRDIGNLRKTKEHQKNRSYRPRVRSEYAEKINKKEVEA